MYINVREKWMGITPNEDGYAVCDECGGMNIRMTSHFDGRDIYGYDYRCECGAHIRRLIKRRADEVWE